MREEVCKPGLFEDWAGQPRVGPGNPRRVDLSERWTDPVDRNGIVVCATNMEAYADNKHDFSLQQTMNIVTEKAIEPSDWFSVAVVVDGPAVVNLGLQRRKSRVMQ